MRQLLDKMRSLATKICDEESGKPNVKGVLLFGSVAKGNVYLESDIARASTLFQLLINATVVTLLWGMLNKVWILREGRTEREP